MAAAAVAGYFTAPTVAAAYSQFVPRATAAGEVPAHATPTATAQGGIESPDVRLAGGRDYIHPALGTTALDEAIRAALSAKLASPALGLKYSIEVNDARTGEQIYSHGADTPRLPASTMKLVTAFNSLNALGPHTRMTTKVVSSGTGEVTIVGAGDSTLTESNLAALAAQTRSALISEHRLVPPCSKERFPSAKTPCRKSQIRVHYVNTLFGSHTAAPGWTKGYVPSVASSVSSLRVLGMFSKTPAVDTAKMFARYLNSKTTRGVFDGRPGNGRGDEVASFKGQSVATQVEWMLLHSDNDVAEALFRQVALKVGQPPTWTGSAAAARSLLDAAGVPTTGVVLRDGSGLSRQDRLVPRTLNAILEMAVDRSEYPKLAAMYYGKGLPSSGRTGTLTSRFNAKSTKCARGYVRAKTGSLRDVISLSGIATTVNGTPEVFTIFINARPEKYSQDAVRKSVDKVVTAIVGC